MEIEETVDRTAREVFSINYLRPFQRLVIMNIVEGHRRPNLLTILPTGAGKSLCFMLPAVLLDGVTIIIYPLLSLMHDQLRRFEKLGIPACILKGGMDRDDKERVYQLLQSKECKVLITNVEMMCQKSVRSHLAKLDIALLVLDEAHTVISWGSSFRPAYRQLGLIARELAPRRILAFTATSDDEITDKLKDEILGEDALVIHGGLDRPNIIYHRIETIFPVMDIIALLSSEESRPALIFCQSRDLTESLSHQLSSYFPCHHYHAGLDKDIRIQREKDFKDDHSGVMCATCAYGMGVDKGDIRTVIHYNLPKSAADYLQESGRGGRDGRICHAYAFLGNSWYETRLEELFSIPGCIRRHLVAVMGQPMDGECAGCDGCDKVHRAPEGLDQVRKAMRIPYLRKEAQVIRKLSHMKGFEALTTKQIARGLDKLVEKGLVKRRFSRVRWIGRPPE